jgi:hypothetical protein
MGFSIFVVAVFKTGLYTKMAGVLNTFAGVLKLFIKHKPCCTLTLAHLQGNYAYTVSFFHRVINGTANKIKIFHPHRQQQQ